MTDFAERRAAARQRLNALDPHMQAASDARDLTRRDWFTAVYETAGGDEAQVPWADRRAHPLLSEWLHQRGATLAGVRALDVGCGLGDNAEALAAAGARVTAFDLVPAAIEWARRRFPQTPVTYAPADVFALPDAWTGAFDFVHEAYTLQALAPEMMARACAAIVATVAPGGRLLVIARARPDDAPASSQPPWPLSRRDIEAFTRLGLDAEQIEAIAPREGLGPHWRALFRRP